MLGISTRFHIVSGYDPYNRMRWVRLWQLLVITWLWFFSYDPYVCGQHVEFTLDFETGDLRGWIPTGNAFYYQPTLGDNPTARNRGQPSRHQGKYWIGTYEKYQGGVAKKPGNVQGDSPQGTLTSAPFTIPKGILSLLVGGGSHFQTRVELLVQDPIEGNIRAFYASGRNTETMHRVEWNLTPFAGKIGRIRIVDESSEGWGHINVDDFRFSSPPGVFRFDKVLPPRDDYKIAIPEKDDTQVIPLEVKVYLKADKKHVMEGENVRFEIKTSPFYRNIRYQFNFGDGTENVWTNQPVMDHVYYKKGKYRAFVSAIIKDKSHNSNPVIIVVEKRPSRPMTRIHPPHLVVKQGEKAIFKSQSPYDPEVRIKEYWNGPGGQKAIGPVFEVDTSQLKPRKYEIVLNISDNYQQTDRAIAILEVLPSVYRVSLEADRNKTIINESVRFTGNIQPGLKGVLYQFDFGDGTRSKWQRDPVTNHTYARPGTYNVSLFAKIGEKFLQSDSIAVTVEPIHIRAYLEAEPDQTEPEGTVIFKARLEPVIEKVEYRFIFGDGAARDWSYEATAEHIYSKPGNYHAYVVSRIDQRNVTESNPVLIKIIIKGPQMTLWIGVSTGFLVLFGGGFFVFLRIKRARKRKKGLKPRIQIRPEIDKGVQQIELKASLQPGFEVQLRPVSDHGKQEIRAEGSLIVEDRREGSWIDHKLP